MSSKKAAPPAEAPQQPAAEWITIDKLRPWVRNPRKNDTSVGRVADSIERFGFGAPIVARRENYEVIAGHTRLKAALQLGLKEVPVRLLDLSEEEAHKLVLADNKLGELAEWDDGALGKILSEMSRNDLPVMGFTDKEFDKIVKRMDDVSFKASTGSTDQSDKVKTSFALVIECDSEEDQRRVIGKLLELGIKCRALT